MERAFKLEGGQRHHDDATSVAAWVEEMRGMGDDNVVLYYKPQGADDDKTGLKREDLLIVLQTPIQAEMFKRFAEGKVVCVDATHGTNAHDFKLITLLVVDEYGEGFPVVWCSTNKEDRAVLIEFLSSVRTRCGMVQPLWFMSDMAEQYYLAWVMCTCGSLLSHVRTYVHHPLRLPHTTFMQECHSGSHNQQLHSGHSRWSPCFSE